MSSDNLLSDSYRDIPDGPVDSGEYKPGSPVELSVTFGLHPPPNAQMVRWRVTSPDGSSLHVGPEEAKGIYSVGPIEQLDDNRYSSTLNIAYADEGEDAKVHELEVAFVDDTKSASK